jgi:hypothetical protein
MNKLNIDLNTIEELFQEPEFNPFDPESRCESGVADLFNQTQELSQKEPVQIVINLANEPDEEELLARTDLRTDHAAGRVLDHPADFSA